MCYDCRAPLYMCWRFGSIEERRRSLFEQQRKASGALVLTYLLVIAIDIFDSMAIMNASHRLTLQARYIGMQIVEFLWGLFVDLLIFVSRYLFFFFSRLPRRTEFACCFCLIVCDRSLVCVWLFLSLVVLILMLFEWIPMHRVPFLVPFGMSIRVDCNQPYIYIYAINHTYRYIYIDMGTHFACERVE